MPLTFAHPAAILPFSRKSKYIHFSAMVFGSMAPDFEYFLRGQPAGEIGHTLSGFLYFNLPIVIIIYCIYRFAIRQTLFLHLPFFLQDPCVKKSNSHNLFFKGIVFCYSALFGMITHVVWDSFTHMNGFMVRKLPILSHTFDIFSFTIPIYKLLQHGSTLVGLTLIFSYISYRALAQKNNRNREITSKRKLTFWSIVVLFTSLFLLVWSLMDHISLSSYGIIVVRIIDSFFLSICVTTLLFKR